MANFTFDKKRDHNAAFGSDIITLTVGPSLQKFYAHKDTLTQSSYFAACLERGFSESNTGIINLPEDDPDVVHALLQYLYTGLVSFKYFVMGTVEKAEKQQWSLVARIYIVADKYRLEHCSSEIMSYMRQVCPGSPDSLGIYCPEYDRPPGINAIALLTHAGLRDCQMRKWLIRALAHRLHVDGFERLGQLGIDVKGLVNGGGYDAEDLLKACLKDRVKSGV